MLTHPTLQQMHALGLKGMADAWRDMAEKGQSSQLDREDWLALMLDREAATRADRRLANRLRQARLRFPEACIEDIDFDAGRGLDRRNILALAQGAWLKEHDNLILTGQTGTGKTWLACAFGHQAARLDLLEICEERYRRRSTLITAQLPVAKWHDLIGEATIADAILDRIVHNAHRITLKGESMRRKNARPDLTPADAPEDNQA